MITEVPLEESVQIEDYAVDPVLTGAVVDLQAAAARSAPGLRDRTVWMVNSTAKGGGVAEMLPRVTDLLNQLGIRTRWLVIGSDEREFFVLTKRIHNLIHGEGEPTLTEADRALYESVSRRLATEIERLLSPEDVLVVHDPQPLAMGAMVKAKLGLRAIWRCHIGLDERPAATRMIWRFLEPYVRAYDHAVFSTPEYIPSYLAGRASIILPAIDPLGNKNRELSPHQLVGVLCNAGLKGETEPIVTPAFEQHALRLRPGRAWARAVEDGQIGLLHRPIVTQISRWDRLKGFGPLLEGFVRLKQRIEEIADDPLHRRRLELLRLVLAGPDPGSVQDDPEATDVLDELVTQYESLSSSYRGDVVILKLPMGSTKENALMVNALQRCSTVVVQNSLREGFGLTATEAMWKGVATLGTHACGLRAQIRSGIDGLIIHDPGDPDEIAKRLNTLVGDPALRTTLSRNARQRVHSSLLVFRQVAAWARLLAQHATLPARRLSRTP